MMQSKSTFTVFTVDNWYRQVDSAKATKLTLYTQTSALVKSSDSDKIVMKHTPKKAGYSTLRSASGMKTVNLNKPFHFLVASLSNRLIFLLELIVAAHATYGPVQDMLTKVALLKSDPDTLQVHYKVSVGKGSQAVR